MRRDARIVGLALDINKESSFGLEMSGNLAKGLVNLGYCNVRDILAELRGEIIDARNSNFAAIKERVEKHNVDRYKDDFCQYCYGKIHALDGICYFVDELEKKYMEE